MPRAIDRRTPVSIDKDPNRFGTDYQDPFGAIGDAGRDYGKQIRDNFVYIIRDLTGIDITGALEFMDWVGAQIQAGLGVLGELWNDLLGGVISILNFAGDIIENTVANFVSTVSRIFGRGDDAALAADKANIGVQRLRAELAGGGFDEFDYASANELPSATYTVAYRGPGAGHYGPNGSGFLVWKPSGSAYREVIYRRDDTDLGSDNMVVTSVWSTEVFDPLFDDAYGYIMLRVSSTDINQHVRARIDNNTAIVENVNVVGGTVTFTQIGATATVNTRNGDVYDFYAGTPTQPRRFWLKQNGIKVLDVVDTAAVSQLGEGFRRVGIGGAAANRLYFLRLGQSPPPSLAGITWNVHTLTNA